MNSRSSGQQIKNDAKTLFFHLLSPFHGNILQLQQYWHLFCFAILGSSSTVIHSVKQRLLRNRPRSALQPLVTSCAKDYKGHSLVQTIFTEPPNNTNTVTDKLGFQTCPRHLNTDSTNFLCPFLSGLTVSLYTGHNHMDRFVSLYTKYWTMCTVQANPCNVLFLLVAACFPTPHPP